MTASRLTLMLFEQAFARATKKYVPNHLRLSIHQSTGQHKVSISLLPTDGMFTTPWHCTVALRTDGSIIRGLNSFTRMAVPATSRRQKETKWQRETSKTRNRSRRGLC